jgi:hypothetical protein
MLKKFQPYIILIIVSTMAFADVFMTELTDPQNSSGAGRYVELYNNGDSDVDFSTGWLIQRWTNGNSGPSTPKPLTGIISAGGFYIVCNDEDKFSATYGLTCDQDIGTGGPADSNGDDNMAILDASGAIVDMFGVAGEDGSGTGHEFEDGRAERADSNTSASATWDEAGWNIDNDSGGGDGNQYAPEGFDPGAWIGAGPASDTCDDDSACNTGAEGACEYPNTGYDCDGNCVGEVDCAGNCGGEAVEDCAGVCNGDSVEDDCGECGGDNSLCTVSVTFIVDMSVEGVTEDIKLRTSTQNGEYMPSDWYVMTDNGDGTYSHTLSLVTGIEYGYNFWDGWYEDGGDGTALENCGGGTYGNDRSVTPGDSDLTLDAVCWNSCEACPEDIPGCMDDTALNYDSNATSDDSSCFYEWPDENLFFSEYAEGSSNNKYLEIYNATDNDVDLSGYSLSSCSNGCNDGVSWDYPDNVTFEAGTTVSAGDVYVVCHGSADDIIQAECDQTFTYLSNGDDVFALTQVGSGAILDIIGTIGDDPGSGWEVAGVSNATKDHTLVRDASVSSGNSGGWEASAAYEWVVLDQNTWDYVGSHPHDISLDCAGVPNGSAALDDCGVCDGGNASMDDCGVCNGDGSSCACTVGDVNDDDTLDVLDVVIIVNHILENGTYDDCADYNGDGAVNVLDVVNIVHIILNGRISDATEAKLIQNDSQLTLLADGFIGAVQLELRHNSDFEIELTNDAMVAEYRTVGNTTKIIIVVPESDLLFDASGDYEIVDMIVADSNSEIETVVLNHPGRPSCKRCKSFKLSSAYPNPFNPSTTINLQVEDEGLVKVSVFNLAGKEVAQLSNEFVEAGDYSMTWVADSYPSGVYLIRANMNEATSVQKVILLK